jgi:hypothetical protein
MRVFKNHFTRPRLTAIAVWPVMVTPEEGADKIVGPPGRQSSPARAESTSRSEQPRIPRGAPAIQRWPAGCVRRASG